MSIKSKLLDNKQLVHIGAEVVVFAGLTFYFSKKNAKLMGHIAELSQRLEEQEDHINKLETAINNIGTLLQNRVMPALTGRPVNSVTPVRSTTDKKKVRKGKKVKKKNSPTAENMARVDQLEQVEQVVEDDRFDDDELDAEIREELDDLDSSENEQEHSLKKD